TRTPTCSCLERQKHASTLLWHCGDAAGVETFEAPGAKAAERIFAEDLGPVSARWASQLDNSGLDKSGNCRTYGRPPPPAGGPSGSRRVVHELTPRRLRNLPTRPPAAGSAFFPSLPRGLVP
ncbi:unnamed protein product, partial [Effrenium voratum]